MQRIAALAFAALWCGATAHAQQAPAADGWRAALHQMPSAPGASLTLGGELRERLEAAWPPGFGLKGVQQESVWLHRLTINAGLSVGEGLRAYVQLGSWFASNRATGRSTTDEDRLDLAQGYVDLSAAAGLGRATLRAGRQEMSFGASRLVSVRESPNMRRSFDGVRAFWKSDAARLDGFVVRPVRLSTGVFDDSSESRELFWGAYATVPVAAMPGLSVDAYYLGLQRRIATFAQGRGREERHTFGGRLFGTGGGWDWDIEAALQVGQFGISEIRAWTAAADLGYSFAAMPWRPRFGVKADIASGDADPRDRRLGTFNALYPRLPYFSEAGLVAPANLIDLQPGVTLHPLDSVEVTAAWDVLWRQTTADAFYTTPLTPLPGSIGGPPFIGHQPNLSVTWTSRPEVEMRAWYVHFFAGDTIRRAGGHDLDYLAGSIALRF
jgi:hypothetical protein